MRKATVSRWSGWRVVLLALAGGWPAAAADLDHRTGYRTSGADCVEEAVPSDGPPMPRYFPHEEGDSNPPRARPVIRRCSAACIPRRAAIPTNAPDDPSYVGSAYGLGKPSYYGFTPAFGVDDPFGRPLRPYCR